MKISTRGRYGLKAMLDLAANGGEGPASLSVIAARQGVPLNYLEQLMAALKKSGYVRSVRGACGGYVLAAPASEISVGGVLRALEGSLAPVECLDGGTECSCGAGSCAACKTRPLWNKIFDSVTGVVDSVSLSELLNDNAKNTQGE